MQSSTSNLASTMSKSMTIDEMRDLHRHALAEAEAKQTELRLVLASRYRELVGSSDEVLDMQSMAKELDALVQSLPTLVHTIVKIQGNAPTSFHNNNTMKVSVSSDSIYNNIQSHRKILEDAPRIIHSHLDSSHVHSASMALLQTFTLISNYTNQYPLANVLSNTTNSSSITTNNGRHLQQLYQNDAHLRALIHRVYLHIQTLPLRTTKLAKHLLIVPSSSYSSHHMTHPCLFIASSLAALNLLLVPTLLRNTNTTNASTSITSNSKLTTQPSATKLLDLYYDAKAKLIHGLLRQITILADSDSSASNTNATTSHNTSSLNQFNSDAAEQILTQIVHILQYDIILYPYHIFILKKCVKHSTTTNTSPPEEEEEISILDNIPSMDPILLKTKVSNFLAAHLPLIRSKVKSILVTIAGMTASRLGNIRQLLYDKTDGIDARRELDENGLCTWEEAVQWMIDVKVVMHGLESITTTTTTTTETLTATSTNAYLPITSVNTNTTTAATSSTISTVHNRKFSLWSTLFSNTFSSLVHSLLSTSFHSVHTKVVTTLRSSLANAPTTPLSSLLPHEAYKNTLRIATDLDVSLKKLSDDAHELLVHAEERQESECRLRQSLYVQTCEIMGRLLNELRRMLLVSKLQAKEKLQSSMDKDEEAMKHYIVGRLCHSLKFRLTSLPKLLDAQSSPATIMTQTSTNTSTTSSSTMATGYKSGMITIEDLQAAFILADDDDDGLVSFEEAMEAMEGAFSGTSFHGAEMVRETMLLSESDVVTTGNTTTTTTPSSSTTSASTSVKSSLLMHRNLTLSELVLLSARGLRHDVSGSGSALGIIQKLLNDIIDKCFTTWAKIALSPCITSFTSSMQQFNATATSAHEMEWKRLHNLLDIVDTDNNTSRSGLDSEKISDSQILKPFQVGSTSTHVMSYFLNVISVLNHSICPSDSLLPFPSKAYASSLGVTDIHDTTKKPTYELTMLYALRSSLLKESLIMMCDAIRNEYQGAEVDLKSFSPSPLIQLGLDVHFINDTYFNRNKYSFVLKNVEPSSLDDEEDIEESPEVSSDYRVYSQSALTDLNEAIISSLQARNINLDFFHEIVRTRTLSAQRSCDMFLSSLFGEDKSIAASFLSHNDYTTSSDSPPLLVPPINSSRRFILLPIQAERSINELQLLGTMAKEQNEKQETEKVMSAASAVSSGLGFLSSMLKKK